MNVVVRPVRLHEARALWQVRLQALREDGDSFDQTWQTARSQGVGPIVALLREVRDRRAFVAVAETRGRLVGLAMLSRSPRPRSQHRARLWGMWVAPEGRRQGVGQQLVDTTVDWCRQQDVEMVDLWVVTSHGGAIRLYEQAGFRVCGTARDGMRWQGEPQAEHQMALHLTHRSAMDGAGYAVVRTSEDHTTVTSGNKGDQVRR